MELQTLLQGGRVSVPTLYCVYDHSRPDALGERNIR